MARSSWCQEIASFLGLLAPALAVACGPTPESADSGVDLALPEPPGLRTLGGSRTGPLTLATEVSPVSITSDASNVYFLSNTPAVRAPHLQSVYKVPSAGGSKTNLATVNDYDLLTLIRVDTTLYFNGYLGSVRSVSVDGAKLSTVFNPGAMGTHQSLAGTGSAFSNTELFCATTDQHLQRLQQSGGGWTATLATQEDPIELAFTANVALTSEFAFFTTFDLGLWRVARDGSSDAFTFDDAISDSLVATDGERVYYQTSTHLASLPIHGGVRTNIVSLSYPLTGLAARNGTVYWTSSNQTTVRKAPGDGSGPVIGIAIGETAPRAVHVDDTYVYWGTPSELRRAPK